MECEFAIHSPLSGRGNQGGCTMNLRAPTVGADGVSTARRRARRNVMEGETVDPSGTLDEDTRLFFEQSPLPQAFTDFDGNFTEVNRTLTQLLGHDRDWFPGREVFSVMHPLDDPTLRGELDRLRKDRKSTRLNSSP